MEQESTSIRGGTPHGLYKVKEATKSGETDRYVVAVSIKELVEAYADYKKEGRKLISIILLQETVEIL